MKQTIGKSQFMDAFHKADRFDQFGYDALELLFDYLEELEADSGEETELDVISICCDYAVSTWREIADDYDVDVTTVDDEGEEIPMDDDEALETVMAYLKDETTVVGTCDDGRIVYQQF
jgi:hypothetical protein